MYTKDVSQSTMNSAYRTLHKLSAQEKENGNIFIKQADVGTGSIVVTYKDFNNDGFITENEVYKIEEYNSYQSANGNTITMINEKIDSDNDGKADVHTRTRIRNGNKVVDKKCLPLEWAKNLVQDARTAWLKEINFSAEDFE